MLELVIKNTSIEVYSNAIILFLLIAHCIKFTDMTDKIVAAC